MRSLFRFGLPTLFAAMLLCISVAGWQRDRQNDAKEQAALDALAKEDTGFVIRDQSDESPWGRLPGHPAPIVSLAIQRMPSDATRRRVLDLPHLERVEIHQAVYEDAAAVPTAAPALEETLGRPLPELPTAIEMADEPPPLPRGTPLSDRDRAALLRAIDTAWHEADAKARSENVLRYADSDHPHEPDIVVARRGSAAFRLERREGKVSRIWPSQVWVTGQDRRWAVQRRWGAGKWRLQFAARTFDDSKPLLLRQEFVADDRIEFEAPSLGTDFVAEDDVDAGDFVSAERLEDGGYALRRRHAGAVDPVSGMTEEGWVVVGPSPAFVVKRSDVADYASPGVLKTDLYETEGETSLLVRKSTWLRESQPSKGGGSRAYTTHMKWQVRYAWELEPDLPDDLFEPARQGQDFFTSEPAPAFRWWYVTGVLSLSAFAGIGAANVRGFAKRRSSRRQEGERDDAEVVASVDRS